MADDVKVLIGEKNGTELEYQEEYALTPGNIPFSDSGFAATDVQAAILEAANGNSGDDLVVHAKQLIVLDEINCVLDRINCLMERIVDD